MTWCSWVGSTLISMSVIERRYRILQLRPSSCCVAQNSAQNSLIQASSSMRSGSSRAATRQLQHVLDDAAHAFGVVADDLRQPPVFGGNGRRFRQQLAGVAHRADGRADLVRDARRQSAQRGQLRLLHLFGEQAGVFQEDQHGPRLRAAEIGEVRLDEPRAVGGGKSAPSSISPCCRQPDSRNSSRGETLRPAVRPARRWHCRAYWPPVR